MAEAPDEPWTPEEAFAAFPTLAIEADSSVDREEQDALQAYLASTPALGADADDVGALIKRVHRAVSTYGEHATLAHAAKALPDELRGAAFRAALAMTWSDDDAGSEENEFLAAAAEALGLDPTQRDRIIEQATAQRD